MIADARLGELNRRDQTNRLITDTFGLWSRLIAAELRALLWARDAAEQGGDLADATERAARLGALLLLIAEQADAEAISQPARL